MSGNITLDRIFADGDFRKNYFAGERQVELVDRVNKLKALIAEHTEVESIIELALRFILSFEEVSTVIPGMREVKYVEQNTAFSDKGALPKDLIKELEKHAWERNFYSGLDPYLKDSEFVEV